MPETILIRRFAANYRLRPSQLKEKGRLDRLIPQLLGEPLELALEWAGVRASEIVCIRRIRIPVRLRLSRTDSDLLAAWARLLAEAIAQGDARDVEALRYPSRSVALIEMGVQVSQGRFHNAWAWRQLGFWRRREDETPGMAVAVGEFAGVLAREPEIATAVMAELAGAGHLRSLLRFLAESLEDVAVAVLAMGGRSDGWREIELTLRQPEVPEMLTRSGLIPASRRPESPFASRAQRVISRSRILSAGAGEIFSERAANALASLALFECEPSIALATTADVAASILAIRSLLKARGEGVPVGPNEAPLAEAGSPRVSRADSLSGEPAVPGFAPDAAILPPAAIVPALVHGPASRPSALPDRAPDELRRIETATDFGGLLFLLRVLDQLDVAGRMMSTGTAVHRGLPWLLHRLALALQPLNPDDPAALVFCGLRPGARHPSEETQAPSSDERLLVNEFADEVRKQLAEILAEAMPGELLTPERAMQFVCRRRAIIAADPGWIELRFSLHDVSTAIRRARLDLDPNYVPWLGVVVRFVYE